MQHLKFCRLLFRRDYQLFTSKVLLSYKSQYSLGVLYPNSQFTGSASRYAPQVSTDSFNGFIPTEKLDFTYLKSSGPGGQNVNKVNSKVEVRFHVDTANWIPDWIKSKLMEQEKSNINKDGYLIVTSDKTRKQLLNQADCMDKIRQKIWRASFIPKEPSEEEKAAVESRKAKARRAVLREKRQHSLKKQTRSC